jgi:Flp pilus assembly protein CpaB
VKLLAALRTKGWSRTVALRRLAASALVVLAAFLALRPSRTPDAPILVANRDLAPGTTLSTSDLRVVRAPPTVIPRGTLTSPESALGRILAGAAADGEPITGVRLVGPENTGLAAGGPGAAAVPVRLADESVAELLAPGSRVDIVGGDQQVLASDAVVVTVRSGEKGRLVVVALPRDVAIRVAGLSLGQGVSITLR